MVGESINQYKVGGEKDGYWANVLASCYARMGNTSEALHFLECAIELLFL